MNDRAGLIPLFDDGKSPDAMRTIGEVASALGIRAHVLRYWEEQFPMLRPVKRSGGRRYYRPADVELIATIDRLVHREGYTLRGARKAIASKDVPQDTGAVQVESVPSGLRQSLMAIRDDLATALAAA